MKKKQRQSKSSWWDSKFVAGWKNPARWHVLAVVLLLVAGAASRLYAAWAGRLITDPDCSVGALMAKHISEGRGLPVFFYGQAYMGSLEPIISAILMFILGGSGFAANLGPALMSFLAIWVVYLWARDAAGPMAGLLALAMLLCGPPQFYLFQAAQRGGYPTMIFLSTLLLWQAARCVSTHAASRKALPLEPGLWLGLVAGLGWWTLQLVVPAILAAGLVLLVGLRRRVFGLRFCGAGVVGFLLGSLPFWVWNIRHEWASMSMVSAAGGVSLKAGIKYLLLRLLAMSHWLEMPRSVALAGAASWLALGGVSGWAFIQGCRRRNLNWYWLAAALYAGFFALIFIHSSFARIPTVRYLLPLVPVLVVLLAAGLPRLPRPWAWWLWIPVLALLAPQWQSLKMAGEYKQRIPAQQQRMAAVTGLLATNAIGACFANYIFYPLNFQTAEKICFTPLNFERYPPYRLRAEEAAQVAILDNHGGVREFLAGAGGSAQHEIVEGLSVAHGFAPPATAWREIAPAAWHVHPQAFTNDDWQGLGDGRWVPAPGLRQRSQAVEWEVTFDRPVDLCAVRIVCDWPAAPLKVSVEPPAEAAAPALADVQPVTGFFWSGARLYYGGAYFRHERAFAPVRTERVRLVFSPGKGPHTWAINELQFFEDSGVPLAAADTNQVAALIPQLAARNVQRVYCDRWEAQQIRVLSSEGLTTSLEPELYHSTSVTLDPIMTLDKHTALLVRPENAPLCERTLTAAGIAYAQQPMAPWVLFSFPELAQATKTDLHWKGFGCFLSGR